MTLQRNQVRIAGLGKRRKGIGIARLEIGLGFFVLSLGLSLGLPSLAFAQAELHELTWAHSAPAAVQSFVVFVSPVDGDRSRSRQIDVGKPPATANSGTMSWYSAVISAELDEFVAVAAVSPDGTVSALSEWSGLPPSQPGPPVLVR